MATNILSIQPREINFRTATNADWLDGLLCWQAGAGGVVAGAANVGNGSLTVEGVATGTALGAHILEITSLDGIPRFTVADPGGTVTARGVAGTQLYAGGITLTLSSGSTMFAVGDTYAVGVLPVPIDITGIAFDLQVRQSATSANVQLSATSRQPDPTQAPTIIAGGSGGQVALRVLRAALARERFAPGSYVYDILASADGLRVQAFYGVIQHVDGVTFLP